MIETTHPRTLEASARCRERGSCHDCAMTCPQGNTIRDDKGQQHPCGSDVFDETGTIVLCGECRQNIDQAKLADVGQYLRQHFLH